MNKKREIKKIMSEKGVSLIITFFIMLIILVVVLFISVLLYSEVKVTKNMSESVSAFFAADSGVEKVLYYDRYVFSKVTGGGSAVRGLCTIYLYNALTNPYACIPDPNPLTVNEKSIYCVPNDDSNGDFTTPVNLATDGHNGCDPSICDDCEVSFSTAFDNRTYSTTAKVYPSLNGKYSNFEIESRGKNPSAGGAERQIKLVINSEESTEAIEIHNACAVPISNPQGEQITISADVTATLEGDTISWVKAAVYDSNGNCYNSSGNMVSCASSSASWHIHTNIDGSACASGILDYKSCTYTGDWSTTTSTPAQTYYVDLEAEDTLSTPNDKKMTDLLPYPWCVSD